MNNSLIYKLNRIINKWTDTVANLKYEKQWLIQLYLENKKPLINSKNSGLSCEGLLSHDEVEIFEADLVSIGGSTLKHFLQFFGAHSLSQLLGDASQIMDANSGRLVVVKQVENSVDSLTRLLVAEFVSDGVEEVFKVNSLLVLMVV